MVPIRKWLGGLLGSEAEFPQVSLDDAEGLRRHTGSINVARVRVLMFTLLLIDTLLVGLWLGGLHTFGPRAGLSPEQVRIAGFFPWTIVGQLVLSVGYLLIRRRPSSPDQIRSWQVSFDYGAIILVVLSLTFRSAVRSTFTGDAEIFVMAILVSGPAVLLPLGWALLLYLAAPATLLATTTLMGPHWIGLPHTLNVVFASIFGLTLSRITFGKARRDYLRRRLIQASTEMVRLSELRYRQLVDNAPIGIFCTKPDGQVIDANPAMLRTLEADSLDALNAIGLPSLYADPSDRTRLWNLAQERGSVSGFETRFRLPSGRVVPLAISAHLVKEREGTVLHLEGTLEDITERQKAAETLKQSERRLTDIISFLPLPTMVIDQQGKLTAWNRAMEELTGVKAANLIGQGDHAYAVPFYGERRPILIDLVFAPEEELAAKYKEVHREGGVLSAEAFIPMLGKDGIILIGFATALRDSQDAIVGAIESVRDITDFRRTQQELKEAKEAAEAANQAKSAFLAMMSHEIRTPMNAIIGMTGILLDGDLDEKQRDFTRVIRDSGEALLTIINDVLDFSKIEAGKLDLEHNPFELRACVESVVDLLAARAAEKKLEIGCLVDPRAPTMFVGDANRLSQILTNLIGNAIKFTEAGEVMVEVDAVLDRGRRYQIHFAVKDTGIGIPAERMDRLFRSFSQVDSSTTRRYGGTGLGLAICKRLSEMMGGKIWVESEPGKGSTFHFTVLADAAPSQRPRHLSDEQPALQGRRVLIVDDNSTNRRILKLQTGSWGMVPVEAASAAQALELVGQRERIDLAIVDLHMPDMDGPTLAVELRRVEELSRLPLVLLSSVGTPSSGTELFSAVLVKPIKPSRLYNVLLELFAPEAPAKGTSQAESKPAEYDPTMADRHPLRILVAEDNLINQKLLRVMLGRLGYVADVVSDGKEAVAALAQLPYDAVLMDVQMPEMDGLEATRRIRAEVPGSRRPQIIAMTANAMAGDREKCLEASMDDYVSKPIRVDQLVAALEKVPSRA
jgi:PAS domain S-box-containing protein